MAAKTTDNVEEICPLCSEIISCYAVGPCDHAVCFKCSTRMRVLCNQMYCAICRTDMPQVIMTRKPHKFDSINTHQFSLYHKTKMYLETEEIRSMFFRLLEHKCKLCRNLQTFTSFMALKDHMRREHSLFVCDLCAKHLKIFSSERKFYDRKKLAEHRRVGDQDDRSHKGHPMCEFCNERYLDNDELAKHLRKDHYFCHFCEADGFSNIFFADYSFLRHHFHDQHFMCDDVDCMNVQFTNAFRSLIDLKAHKATVHSKSMRKAQVRQARAIDININLVPRRTTARRERKGVVTAEDYAEVDQERGGGHGRNRRQYASEREEVRMAQALTASIAESEKGGNISLVNPELINSCRNIQPEVRPQEVYRQQSSDFPDLAQEQESRSYGHVNDGTRQFEDTLAMRLARGGGLSVQAGSLDVEDFPSLGSKKSKSYQPPVNKAWQNKYHQGSNITQSKVVCDREEIATPTSRMQTLHAKPATNGMALYAKSKMQTAQVKLKTQLPAKSDSTVVSTSKPVTAIESVDKRESKPFRTPADSGFFSQPVSNQLAWGGAKHKSDSDDASFFSRSSREDFPSLSSIGSSLMKSAPATSKSGKGNKANTDKKMFEDYKANKNDIKKPENVSKNRKNDLDNQLSHDAIRKKDSYRDENDRESGSKGFKERGNKGSNDRGNKRTVHNSKGDKQTEINEIMSTTAAKVLRNSSPTEYLNDFRSSNIENRSKKISGNVPKAKEPTVAFVGSTKQTNSEKTADSKSKNETVVNSNKRSKESISKTIPASSREDLFIPEFVSASSAPKVKRKTESPTFFREPSSFVRNPKQAGTKIVANKLEEDFPSLGSAPSAPVVASVPSWGPKAKPQQKPTMDKPSTMKENDGDGFLKLKSKKKKNSQKNKDVSRIENDWPSQRDEWSVGSLEIKSDQTVRLSSGSPEKGQHGGQDRVKNDQPKTVVSDATADEWVVVGRDDKAKEKGKKQSTRSQKGKKGKNREPNTEISVPSVEDEDRSVADEKDGSIADATNDQSKKLSPSPAQKNRKKKDKNRNKNKTESPRPGSPHDSPDVIVNNNKLTTSLTKPVSANGDGLASSQMENEGAKEPFTLMDGHKDTENKENVYSEFPGLNDFPVLSSTQDSLLMSSDFGRLVSSKEVPAKITSAPPPGFSNTTTAKPGGASAPPPGFAPAKPPPGPPPGFAEPPLTSRTTVQIVDPVSSHQHYIQPFDFKQRNERLITTVQNVTRDDEEIFSKFKSLSGEFRRGNISGSEYYVECGKVLGVESFGKVFPELLVLLPDIAKQQELLKAHAQAQRDTAKVVKINPKKAVWGSLDIEFSTCSICQQVLEVKDLNQHMSNHDMDSEYPALGSSSRYGIAGMGSWKS